jgi:tetratricopeptide (TPR) repeat protein
MTEKPAPRRRAKAKTEKVEATGDTFKLSGDFRGAVVNIKSTIVGAAEVRELESLPPEPGDPPYLGLQYYDESNAERFFGREMLTAKLVAHLAKSRFLAVIGDSGSGKSSLVRAGVIPALRKGEPLADGALPPSGSPRWDIRVLTPTAHPLEALAAALTRGADSLTALSELSTDLKANPRALLLAARSLLDKQEKPRLLLVVDQFEEVFSQCREESERRAFLDALLAAVDPQDEQPISVLILLRADFYARLAQYDQLRELVVKQQEFIGAMNRDELARAIVLPAAQGNWKIQEGLVEVMLNDIGAEPGALPLLSHALLETWKRRRARTMTLSGYTEAGGVRGAIARTAEAVFQQRLTDEQRPIARMIFLSLAELDEDAQDTRRRASFSELITRSTDAATIEAVLSILTDARLVITGYAPPADTKVVEVAHEALIREWPTLRQWLAEDREGLILHRQLSDDTAGWLRLEKDSGVLYRTQRLKQASAWAEKNPAQLSLDEAAFLEAGVQQEQDEEARRKRYERDAWVRRWVFPLGGMVLVGVLVLLFFLTGLNNRFKTPATMTGAFNVAVAEFGGVGQDGVTGPAQGEGGQTVSGWVAKKLIGELANDPNMLVWYDSAELRRENVTIGRIEGVGPAERAAAAQAMAERLNADILVFGDIDTRQTPAQLVLEFWIAPQLEYHFEDIQGSYQTGEPIEVFDPAKPTLQALPEINRQASTLAWLALGLTRTRFGQSAEALEAFQNAAGFTDNSAVAHFFIGRETLFLSDSEPVSTQQVEVTFQAENAFRRALELDPDYARAAIGLGSVYFAQAKRLVAGEYNLDEEAKMLGLAQPLAEQALKAYNQVAGMPVENGFPTDLAARLGAGTSLRLLGEILQRLGQDDEARARLEESVSTLEGILEPLRQAGQERYLAQAYQALASAYEWLGNLDETQQRYEESQVHYTRAIENYNRCIDLGQGSADQLMREDIIDKLCTPFRDKLQEYLGVNGGG